MTRECGSPSVPPNCSIHCAKETGSEEIHLRFDSQMEDCRNGAFGPKHLRAQRQIRCREESATGQVGFLTAGCLCTQFLGLGTLRPCTQDQSSKHLFPCVSFMLFTPTLPCHQLPFRFPFQVENPSSKLKTLPPTVNPGFCPLFSL